MTVVEDDRQADNLSLTVADPHLVYADALMEGALVEVDMGYSEPGEHALLLKAIVTKVETSYPQDGVPLLTVKGEDRSITMGLVEHKKHWRDMAITEIVREVAGAYGFSRVQAELSPDPKTDKKPIYQDGKTDLAFLQELAEQHKARCFVELDTQGQEVLYFIPERKIVQLRRPETLTFRYRKGPDSNLISFSPGFDASYIDRFRELNDVDAKGETIKSRDKPSPEPELWLLDEARVKRAGTVDGPKVKEVYKAATKRKKELQGKLAKPRPAVGRVERDQGLIDDTNNVLESRKLGMTATGTTFGNVRLRSKSNLKIEGVSARFDGEWYCSTVTHRIGAGGHTTEFKCVR